MKNALSTRLLLCLVLPCVCGMSIRDCGLVRDNFEQISETGFDPLDSAADHNDYAWSMVEFESESTGLKHVYVGTGNNIVETGFKATAPNLVPGDPRRPAEIRRYRPDLGSRIWEVVLDVREFENGPPFTSTGFRKLLPYRAQNDGVLYLYAATFADAPSLWRSATGDPGSWSKVFSLDRVGSIRALAVHNGILYLGTTIENILEGTLDTGQGELLATDGESFWTVVDDGFGNSANFEIVSLASFNGWLYAGTRNRATGMEVWKLEGPEGSAGPVNIFRDGGSDPRNEMAGTMLVYMDQLYLGTMIYGGKALAGAAKYKPCDLLRILPDDSWETVVGEDGISGSPSGFGWHDNAYLWMLEEYQGWLYAGTFDQRLVTVKAALDILEDLGNPTPETLQARRGLERLAGAGADLYKSPDGVTWTPVFRDGLGNPSNYGVRTMESTGDALFLGTANPFDGLEVFRSTR